MIGERQTYLNMIYLLISFPLGVAYFVFLVTGISLGLGLVITLVGIPLLVLMTFLWYWVGIFERELSSNILGIDIRPVKNRALKQKDFLKKVTTHLSQPITWKSLAYLFIKFPLGILSFVALVTLLSVSLSLAVFPIVYYSLRDISGISFMAIDGVSYVPQTWQVFLVAIVGILLLFVSMHLLNGLAYVSGLFAKILLGGAEKRRKK